MAFTTIPLAFIFLCRVFYIYYTAGFVPNTSHLLFWFMSISGLQALLFAMWFDMEYNKNLK